MESSEKNGNFIWVRALKRKVHSRSVKSFFIGVVFLATLAACGGGSGGGGTPSATIKGQVVDTVLPGANVSLYSGGFSGKAIGTAKADSNGNYQITFTPPSGSTPLFLKAISNGNTLSSYIGSANKFSGTVTASTAPNLNVTQVTTSTLAVIQNQGVLLSSLTPTTYSKQILNLENAIIQLAAVVQDIVDQTDKGCALSSGSLNPSNLANLLGSSPITATSNIITKVSSNLSSCSSTTLKTLASQIPSNQTVAPQLTSTSATVSSTNAVPAGTYSGILTPILTNNSTACNPGTMTPFTATFTVSSNGNITFSSNNNNNYGSGTGTLNGYNFSINGTDGSGNPLSATGAFALLPSGSVSGGSGFSVNGGWQITCSSGGTYGGTYNAPDLLTSGAALTNTPSSITNGTYSVTGFSYNNTNTSSNCGGTYQITGIITINGSTITFNGGTSNSGTGSGTLAGNTFTMTVTPGSGGGTITVTGVINSQTATSISISGSFQESNNLYCNGSGTFSIST